MELSEAGGLEEQKKFQRQNDDIQHYRLSSIKGVRFRFANFASHFIRVQIFQIDFPLILYL